MQKEELLRKYLAGISTPEDEKKLFGLLKDDASTDEYRVISYELWLKLEGKTAVSDERSTRMYGQISRKIDVNRQSRWATWQFAAAVTMLLLVSAIFLKHFNHNIHTVTTAYAEQQSVELPDGSTVFLNANSTLSYPEEWDQAHTREVWLEGEAYFQVSKIKNTDNQRIKFIVHAQDLDIQVLGTQFNVQNRNQQVEVVLAEGRVYLQNQEAGLTMDMQVGELVAYSSEKRVARKEKVSTDQYTAWKDGKYIFDNQSLKEIAQLIKRNYGKEIQFATEGLADKHMSATIPSTELEVLLQIIEQTLGVEIYQSGQTITISDKTNPHSNTE